VKKQWNRIKYVLGLCVLLLLLYSIGSIFNFIFCIILDIPYDSLAANIAEIIVHMASFIAVIAVGLKDQKKTFASVCFFKKVSGVVWGAAILCAIGYALFNFYFHFLFFSFAGEWNTEMGAIEGGFFFNLINLALIPAVAEEILFKGLVFTILKKYYSTITAVIIASLMFAVCHFSFLRIVPLFLLSCYTFWLYLRIGNLILPMLLHFTNNLLSFVLISEPFAYLGTFYAALALFVIGSYFLYKYSKAEQKAGNHKPPNKVLK